MMAMYRISPERSRLFAEVRSSIHPIRGEAGGVRGDIEVELADDRIDLRSSPKARVEIETDALKTGNSLYDRELERRIDARKYPVIRGEVLEVRTADSPNRYHVRGNLALHGRTQTLEGQVNVRIIDSKAIEIEGEKMLDMRDYGLEPPKILMLRVYPEVRVWGRIVAERVE
jgi:polyisoprenoid-binding protein YceI